MFSYIKGITEEITHDHVVIECGGIGYKVNMPFSQSAGFVVGETVRVHTYMYIREGILDLYGFNSKDSLKTFEMLLSVSGIGPKAAIAVLSIMTATEFAITVSRGDFKTLTKVPGIGAKTAQRVVLELKDKFKGFTSSDEEEVTYQESNMSEEAMNGLIGLGYSPADAKKAIFAVKNADSIEMLIKEALKSLM